MNETKTATTITKITIKTTRNTKKVKTVIPKFTLVMTVPL